jgi:argininosuccinate lyase
LQEDKEPLFDAHDQALAMTRIASGAIAATKFDEACLRRAASDPALIATEAADYLVAKGIPFREAHEIIGNLVRDAESSGENYSTWPVEKLKKYSPTFGTDFSAALTLDASLARHRIPGGTAPESVREALAEARTRLAEHEKKS